MLTAAKADVDRTDCRGGTPLFHATRAWRVEVVRLLGGRPRPIWPALTAWADTLRGVDPDWTHTPCDDVRPRTRVRCRASPRNLRL